MASHQRIVRTRSGDRHFVFFKAAAVEIVEFIAMTVSFARTVRLIQIMQAGTVMDVARIGAKPHRSAFANVIWTDRP